MSGDGRRRAYGEEAAFFVEGLHVAVGVDERRVGVESGDEVPLLDGVDVLLPFDDEDFVCPDGVVQGFDVGILRVV